LAVFAAAERLAQLMKSGPQLSRDFAFWAFAGVVITVILVFSALWATRLSTTGITIRGDASELSFTLQKAQQLLGPLAVGSLRAAGLSAIEIPQRGNAPPQVLEMKKEGRLGLMARAGARQRDSLTIDVGSLPTGTAVWLGVGDRSWAYKLFLRLPKGGEISATALGSVAIQVPDFGNRSQNFDTPRTIRLAFDRDADLMIELRGDDPVRLRPEISVTRLDLHRLPQHVSVSDRDGTASSADSGVRPISTLLRGTIIFDDLANQQAVLHPGQQLFVHPIGNAELLDVVLGKEHISFTLQGTVAGLKTGSAGQRNLMPDRLQYFQNQDWAKLGGGVLSALIALLAALAAWSSRRSA
jgi:hypothetical protein